MRAEVPPQKSTTSLPRIDADQLAGFELPVLNELAPTIRTKSRKRQARRPDRTNLTHLAEFRTPAREDGSPDISIGCSLAGYCIDPEKKNPHPTATHRPCPAAAASTALVMPASTALIMPASTVLDTAPSRVGQIAASGVR